MSVFLSFESKRAEIRYEGVYDLEAFLQMIREWFGYRHFEFYEKLNKKKPMAHGFEHEIDMFAHRKETDYIRNWIHVYVHSQFTEDVEVIENGVKKKLQKSDALHIKVYSRLELDWQNRWEGSEFKRKMRDFFHKFIISSYIGVLWADRLYYITYKLHTKIKEFFDFQNKYNAYENIWQT